MEDHFDLAMSKDASAKAASAATPTLKKGDKVKILRPESFWFQETGEVVSSKVAASIRYTTTVRFDKPNYAGIFTNDFAVEELELNGKSVYGDVKIIKTPY